MKKHIIIMIFVLFFIFACVGHSCNASTDGITEFILSTTNKLSSSSETSDSTPIFYGVVEINLRTGDEFDLQDSVFRTFAKDDIDGDLTQQITIEENTVNVNSVGNYHITYSVTNSSGSTATLEVPVNITESGDRTVKRSLYKLEQSWSSKLISSNRGYYQDKQNLGLYMKAGSSLSVRLINNYNENISITGEILLNDEQKETEFTLSTSDEWQTITADYNSVPFIKSNEVPLGSTYSLSDDTNYGLRLIELLNEKEGEDYIYFANIFETKANSEILSKISIPVYNCDSLEVYIAQINDDTEINNAEYTLLKSIKNNTDYGYTDIILDDKIEINSNKFIIAVKYTGKHVPANGSSETLYTYTGSSLNDFKILDDGDNTNIAPIICETTIDDMETLIEININELYEENSKIESLTYYLYGDDEEEFFNEWNENKASYAVIESSRMTFLTPIRDKNNIVTDSGDSYYFSSIDEMLEYYDDILSSYDEFLGVSMSADNKIDKNVLERNFIKANINGAGMAYYATTHIGFNGNSIEYFFYKNWMSLHEIAHSYEGEITSLDLAIGDTVNNIFAYYYQLTYLKENDTTWLGEIIDIEKDFQEYREMFETFNDIDDLDLFEQKRYECGLYFFVNMLNKIDPNIAMPEMYKYYRQMAYNYEEITAADILAVGFSESTGYDLTHYFETWKIELSDSAIEEIQSHNYPTLYYLRELTSSDEIAELIREEEGLEGIYSLVTEEEYEEYMNDIIDHIEIVSLPEKVEYIVGDELDLTGLKMGVTLKDGTTFELESGYTISEYDLETEGNKTITIEYCGYTASFEITVKESNGEENPSSEKKTSGEENPNNETSSDSNSQSNKENSNSTTGGKSENQNSKSDESIIVQTLQSTKTGDSIVIYVLILVITLIILGIGIWIRIKKKKNKI